MCIDYEDSTSTYETYETEENLSTDYTDHDTATDPSDND